MFMQSKNIVKFNSILNAFEIKKKNIVMSSAPRTIGIGAHFFCNAKCIFCLGGNYPNFSIDRYKRFFEEKLDGVLNKTENVDFHGYGELLLMPDINKFIKHVNKALPFQLKTFFTNGIAVKNINFDDGKYNVIVSLHASNKELHRQISGVDCFDEIIGNIAGLQKQRNVNITLYSVLNIYNITDICDFIELAYKLNVKNIIFKYLTIFNFEHLKLSPFFCKKTTNYNIRKAKILSEKLGISVDFPPIFFHRENKEKDISCMKPWDYCYIENQGTVNMCCYAGKNIGNLEKISFNKLWNSKKYQILREQISLNKPDGICGKCINYNKNNINKISSHITFRPSTYGRILKHITDNKEKYGLKMEEII